MAHIKTRRVGRETRYDVCWREHGRDRSRTFTLRKDAERFRTEREREQQLGALYDAPAITLREARADFRARWMIGKAASTVERKDDAWPHLAELEPVPLIDLRPAMVDDVIAKAARVAPRQAQIATGELKQILRDAQARGQRFAPELLQLKAPSYQEREPIFLTFDEVLILASWSTQPRLLLFLALSGLRIGEALALRDVDVDRQSRSVLVQRAARKGVEGRTKTRKRRRVYLCDRAWQALLEQLVARPANVKGLVFPSPRGNLWNSDNFRHRVFAKAIERATTAAKKPDDTAERIVPARREEVGQLDLHDLRHTFASLMIAAGANPLQIAEALGHSDRNGRPDPSLVWKRYGHLYPGSSQEAVLRLDTHLEALAS